MKIAVLIPAYNEESRIGCVIDVVKQVDIIDEIIVIDDGSMDYTYKIAVDKGVTAIRLPENKGKGAAIMEGVHNTDAEIIVLLDADLVGLTPLHVINLIKPIQSNKCSMTYGLFSNGRVATDLAQKVAPFLSGQRVVKRKIFEDMEYLEIVRFGFEVALTNYVRKNNISYLGVPMSNMTHVMKEEKLGFVKGFTARIKMYWEIVKTLKIS
jgi:glycosyltransferase involved in cell wall biosynthesis